MSRVKCLFGYHEYNEKWKVKVETGIKWKASMLRNIFICSKCRKSLKYMYSYKQRAKDFTLFEVVEEYDDRFIIRNSSGELVLMMKCKRL